MYRCHTKLKAITPTNPIRHLSGSIYPDRCRDQSGNQNDGPVVVRSRFSIPIGRQEGFEAIGIDDLVVGRQIFVFCDDCDRFGSRGIGSINDWRVGGRRVERTIAFIFTTIGPECDPNTCLTKPGAVIPKGIENSV